MRTEINEGLFERTYVNVLHMYKTFLEESGVYLTFKCFMRLVEMKYAQRIGDLDEDCRKDFNWNLGFMGFSEMAVVDQEFLDEINLMNKNLSERASHEEK